MLDILKRVVAPEHPALPLYALRPAGLPAFIPGLPEFQAAFLAAHAFKAKVGQLVLLPGDAGVAGAVLGLGTDETPFAFGSLASRLPPATVWRIEPGDFAPEDALLGFLLGAYRFDGYRRPAEMPQPARLAAQPSPRVSALVTAVAATRDLINKPANHLGPAELAAYAVALGQRFGAVTERVSGAELAVRYPAIVAVGAGSDRAPEAVLFRWTGSGGTDGPKISLCGKGVCFDTGGYDLKPSAGMLRMKKDMGGAAIVLGVAQAIMTLDLPVQLAVRVGCVENSVSGHAMRPSDVIVTRAGLSVEIGNTDAEGRLVLCDLLAEAADESPDWLIDAATLTGAARVALGPDLPALFCNSTSLADALLAAGAAENDPLWRLPLHDGYDSWLDSTIADLSNVSVKPLAGAITAALYLQRFVKPDVKWAHIDVYAWNDTARPGRPEGGEAQTLRAVVSAISTLARRSVN